MRGFHLARVPPLPVCAQGSMRRAALSFMPMLEATIGERIAESEKGPRRGHMHLWSSVHWPDQEYKLHHSAHGDEAVVSGVYYAKVPVCAWPKSALLMLLRCCDGRTVSSIAPRLLIHTRHTLACTFSSSYWGGQYRLRVMMFV